MITKILLDKIRLFVVALLLPTLVFIPPPVQAFDVWSLLDELATVPGSPYPSELPTPSQIKGVVKVAQECIDQPASDMGLIACVEKILDDPVLGKDLPADKIKLAIDIYLTLKAGDYIGLAIMLGKPLACIAANVIVGFDVCGAIDALIAVGGAVVSLVKAFVEGLNNFTEWVGSLLGGPSGGSSSSGGGYSEQTLLLNFFRETSAQAFLYRLSPDVNKWNQHIQKLRQAALSTYKLDGVTAIGVLSPPAPFTVDQAMTAFIGEVGDRWDKWYHPGDGGQNGQDQLRSARGTYHKANRQSWAVAQYNAADEGARTNLINAASQKCQSDDLAGKTLENWKFERGTINPSRIPNNEPSRKSHCDQVSNTDSVSPTAWSLKQAALRSGCTVKQAGGDFDQLICTTNAGLESCKKAVATLQSNNAGFYQVNQAMLCQTQAAPAGQDFANVLKIHDPKGRCVLQAGGMAVNCARDLSVSKACERAKKDYATDLAGNVTVATNKPIINVSCSLQRDGEYSGLVSQTAAVPAAIAARLKGDADTAISSYNNWQSNPQLKIAAGASSLFSVVATVSPQDPLVVVVQAPQGTNGDWIRNAVLSMSFPFGKLGTEDGSDPENDGQNKPAVRFVPPSPSAEQQKQFEQIADAIDKKVKGLLTAPPPIQAGTGRSDARINPSDFAGRTDPIGRLLSRADVATRFTPTELQFLAGLNHTRNAAGAFSYKALGTAEIATLQKAQIATQQLGLGGFAIGQ
jgi:hypothetical protein